MLTTRVQVFFRGAGESNGFSSIQRISTFLPEKEFREDLRAKRIGGVGISKKFESIRRVPVDVREYEIRYSLIRGGKATATG